MPPSGLDTYRGRRRGGRALRREALLSGGTRGLRLPRWRIGATSGLALRHNGLELLQLLVFHQELVLHFHLHDVNASALHMETAAMRTRRWINLNRQGSALTHTFFLPLELRVCDCPMQALLHASLVRQLPLQPLRSGFQLALQRALVILVDFCCFLQDVNLKQNITAFFYKKRNITPFIQGLNDFFFVSHLMFIHLCPLLQTLDLRLVVLDDSVLLRQFIVMFLNSIFRDSLAAVQLLKHGLQRVGLNTTEERAGFQHCSSFFPSKSHEP